MDSAGNFLLPKPSIVICIASLLLASVILAVGQTENVDLPVRTNAMALI
jgi:hypothetical protein